MIRAIIVDDEKKSAELLQLKLARFCPSVTVLWIFTDAGGVAEYVTEHAPDVVFLDIEMPGADGLSIARQVKSQAEVVFVTAYDKYSIEALRITVLDYLLKPIDENELKNCIGRLEEKLQQKRAMSETTPAKNELRKINTHFDKIALPTLEGIHFVNIKEIIRVESESNYSIFHFSGKKKMVVSKTLKQVEDLLETYNFYRPHRSNLINMDFISKYIRGEGGTIMMTDGSEVEVSRMKKKEFLELMGLPG